METLPETEATDAQTAPVTSPRRRRPGTLTLLGTAVAVVVVAALVLSLIDLTSQHDKASRLQHLETLRATATKAADNYGVEFGSYDYRNLHGATAAWTQIEAHSTARFAANYKKTSSALQPTIVSYKATAAATVPVSAVTTITPSRAVVLMVLRQTITNSTQKSGPQSQQFVVVMTLLYQKGQWLIDDVQASV